MLNAEIQPTTYASRIFPNIFSHYNILRRWFCVCTAKSDTIKETKLISKRIMLSPSNRKRYRLLLNDEFNILGSFFLSNRISIEKTCMHHMSYTIWTIHNGVAPKSENIVLSYIEADYTYTYPYASFQWDFEYFSNAAMKNR